MMCSLVKRKKNTYKLETSGRIAAFLGALDTQEKANSPQAPGLTGVNSQKTAR